MKAFCFLISILFASFALAQEQEWFDAEGKVVRVTKKEDNSTTYTPSWLDTKNSTPEIYRWNARTINEYRTSSRSRAIYYGSYWGGYRYYRPFYRHCYPRVQHYGGYYGKGFYGSSRAGFFGYRGSNGAVLLRW